MTALDTSLPVEVPTGIDVIRGAALPGFLAAYFERQKEQLQNEERLCAEVLQIPVSEFEVRGIQGELRRSINETFGTNDV